MRVDEYMSVQKRRWKGVHVDNSSVRHGNIQDKPICDASSLGLGANLFALKRGMATSSEGTCFSGNALWLTVTSETTRLLESKHFLSLVEHTQIDSPPAMKGLIWIQGTVKPRFYNRFRLSFSSFESTYALAPR